MVLNNIKIVTLNGVIDKGYIVFDGEFIREIGTGNYAGFDNFVFDGKGQIAMPGFIDVHIHGSCGIDFMDADVEGIKKIANALYSEGVTTFLATTLTSDNESLKKVCQTVKEAKEVVPSLGGIHFEGPYINAKYKGAQNDAFIREPSIDELKELIEISGNNVRYISMAPEYENAPEFIKYAVSQGVTVSAGHSDATFDDMAKAIECGLTNTTHTHNAMSGHHHRKPGIVTAAMYFDQLNCEVICDTIHVCPNTLKTFYKVIGPKRFMIITDALQIKHADVDKFQLFGLDCIRKDGAAYLTTGPLAGSLLTMDQGIRNIKDICGADLVDLMRISSYNAAKSIHMHDRGELQVNKKADIVLLSDDLQVNVVYKEGKKVFERR